MNFDLHILSVTDKGVRCATATSTGSPFWLPRGGHVEWAQPPGPGNLVKAIVPEWLAAKHRQLMGEVEFERVKKANAMRKETQMSNSDRPEDAGHGAMFRNEKKEKPSHPDYKGDVTVHGKKFWISGWIKEGQKGKYMSLALRPADEQNGTSKKKSASTDDAIPF